MERSEPEMEARMSRKNKKRKGRPGGGPSAPDPDAVLSSLEALRPSLEAGEGRAWGEAHKLLLKTSIEAARLAPMVIGRDLELFDHLLLELRGEAVEPAAVEPAEASTEALPEIPAETLKKAMKAFRRRVKLMKLDMESKLGVGPMSGGRAADFDSIMPPQEFPPEVWATLAAEGRLVATGRGFYKLPES